MQNEKSQFSKPNIQSKLRLKRNNSDSSQSTLLNKNSENDANNQDNSSKNSLPIDGKSSSPCKTEDSMADFKSPKEEKVKRPIISKFKVEAEKAKKKIPKSKSKATSKSRRSSIDQPSIESSFFKPQSSKQNEVKESFPCPVCLKPYKDDETRTNHMKSCAAKNNVSVRQLLDAKELLNRQAEERKAMGLLAAPVIPERKKAFRSKNYTTGDDPQLQLVLAMSESLYEAEKMEFEQAALLAGISPECVKEMSDEQHKSTLQGFGFTTNRPISDALNNRNRRKKLLGPTILQTRSKEDKDRVLTERIACILTGDDALTQAQPKPTANAHARTATVLRSKILKKIEQIESKLWDRSRLTKRCDDFYAKDLKSQLIESKDSPGIASQDSENVKRDDEQNIELSNTSIVYEPMEIDILDYQETAENKSNVSNMSNKNESNDEVDYVKNVSSNWRTALNDSSASDVLIFVKDEKYIFAHKLVFHVQCSNLLLHIEPNYTEIQSHIKEKIFWPGKDQKSALAFLEFVYCGAIEQYADVFGSKNLLSEVENLARLYKVQDLFTYIRKKQNVLSTEKQKNGGTLDTNVDKEVSLVNHETQNISLVNKCNNLSNIEILSSEEKAKEQDEGLSVNKTVLCDKLPDKSLSVILNNRRFTASPDLFESDGDESLNSATTLNKNTPDARLSSNNSKTAVDSDAENFEENYKNTPNHENVASEPSALTSPREDIAEAITPIFLRSPETQNSEEELVDDNDDEMSGALTPNSKRSPNRRNIKREIIFNEEEEINEEATLKSVKERLDNLITLKKIVHANIEIQNSTSQGNELDGSDSLHNALTPPPQLTETRVDKPIEPNKGNATKAKSDISHFIEKVKRQNARGILDSDSESDSPLPTTNFRYRTNPFSKKHQDDSYAYLRNDGKKFVERRRGISLLEEDVLRRDQQSSQTAHKKIVNAPTVQDDTLDITENETEMSLYSRYKKTNVEDNSIAKYREKLGFVRTNSSSQKPDEKDNSEQDKLNCSNNTSKKSLISNTIPKRPVSPVEDITLVSDSDEESIANVKSVASPRKSDGQRNSSIDSNYGKEDRQKSHTNTEISNIENDSTFPLELVDERAQKAPTFTREQSAVAKDVKDHVIDLSQDSDEDGIHDDSTFPNNIAAGPDDSLEQKKHHEKDLEKSKNQEPLGSHAKEDADIDIEISKILGSSEEFLERDVDLDNVHGKTEEKLVPASDRDNQREVINLSPISIISSPEDGHCKHSSLQKDANKSLTDRNEKENDLGGNDQNLMSIDNEIFNEINFDEWDNRATPPREEVENMNRSKTTPKSNHSSARITKSPKEIKTSKTDDMSSLISSPILSQTRRYSKGKTNKNQSIDNEKSDEKTRKLGKKSSSALDFTEKSKENSARGLQRSSSFTTPESRKYRKSEIRDGSVTPPLDYNSLETPELKKQLKRFGLKPNLSREKAKLILTHIYEETHPIVPALKRTSSAKSSSEDDGPPLKKKHTHVNTSNTSSSSKEGKVPSDKKNVKKSSKKHTSKDKTDKDEPGPSSQSSAVIAEEMDYDEPDANDFETPVSMKDVFYKLIQTNKELHTKVLTYKPLPLETLHLMLKENGLKCKINALMDFLDEQCITFQVQTGKGSRTKKRK